MVLHCRVAMVLGHKAVKAARVWKVYPEPQVAEQEDQEDQASQPATADCKNTFPWLD